MKRALALFAVVSLLVMSSAAAQSPRKVGPLDVQPLADGNFDAAFGSFFGLWMTFNQSGGSGTWFGYGILSPVDSYVCTNPAPPVFRPNYSAITATSGSGSHILYQDVLLPWGPSVVSFYLFLRNQAVSYYAPDSLDYGFLPNQQFRADIVSPYPAINDSSSVIQNLYRTKAGDPLTNGGYQHITRTLTPSLLLGKTVRLRFAEVDNQGCLTAAIDDVAIYPVVHGDFNFDGHADVFWRNSVTGENVIWRMNDGWLDSPAVASTVADLNYKFAGVGSIDGIPSSDIYWRNEVTGQVVIWRMIGLNLFPYSVITLPIAPGLSWNIEGVRDVDGDAKADVIWRNIATGDVAVWLMDGGAIRSSAQIGRVGDLNWRIVNIGDLNGDGRADLIWRNASTGANAAWLMDGLTFTPQIMNTVPDPHWTIAAVGDVSHDGKADLIWHNDQTGQVAVWLMDGATMASAGVVNAVPDPAWHIEAAADFNGDTRLDLFWRNVVTGQTAMWQLSDWRISNRWSLPAVNLNWKVVGPR